MFWTLPAFLRLRCRAIVPVYLLPVLAFGQLPFDKATVTQVVGDVDIVHADTMEEAPAHVNEVFKAPDIMQTGRRSRAQLTAPDDTVTRVGSNTIFSFDANSRTIDLKQGSVLFNSPSGNGGGTIRTASATASVVGTTIAVAATSNGGFKILVLEGLAQVRYPNGVVQNLRAGQMTFVLPGQMPAAGDEGTGEGGTADAGEGTDAGTETVTGGEPGPVLEFDLEAAVEGSDLVNGFETSLASVDNIQEAIQVQNAEIDGGALEDTGILIVETTGDDSQELIVVVTERVNEDTETYSPEVQALRRAAQRDVTLPPTGTFPPDHTFTDPFEVPQEVIAELFPNEPHYPNDPFDQVFLGFMGQDVTITDDVVNLSRFDSALYNGRDRVVEPSQTYYLPVMIVASDQMIFNSPTLATEFTGMSRKREVVLAASNGFVLPEDYQLKATFDSSASYGSFDIYSGVSQSFYNNVFTAYNAELWVETGSGNLTITNSSLMATGESSSYYHIGLNTPNNIFVDGTGFVSSGVNIGNDSHSSVMPANVSVLNSTFSGVSWLETEAHNDITLAQLTGFEPGGSLTAKAGRDISLTNSTSMQVGSLNLEATRNLLVQNVGTSNLSMVDLKADQQVKASQLTVYSFAEVNIAAPTVLVSNTTFPYDSTVNIKSQIGGNPGGVQFNTTFVPGSGKIFLNNVTHGSTPINNATHINPSSGPGIYTSNL